MPMLMTTRVPIMKTVQEFIAHTKTVELEEMENNQTGIEDYKEEQELDATLYQSLKAFNQLEDSKDETLQTIHPAQDFINDTLYYGFYDYTFDELYLVNSQHEFFEAQYSEAYGVKVSHERLPLQHITKSEIGQFLRHEHLYDMLDINNIMESIEGVMSDYIYLEDENELILISLWILGTYMFRCFTHYPYLWLHAEKGGGKTTLLDIISRLAFNGNHIDATSSTAAMVRKINGSSPTLLIDEMESMHAKGKDELEKILLSGFRKGGKLEKCKPTKDGDFEIETFDIYCPKAFACIGDISDTLKDRCITINMMKKPRHIDKEKFVIDHDTKGFLDWLKGRLYLTGLLHAKEIYAKYRGKSVHFPLPEFLSDREQDLWRPLYTLAMHLDLATEECRYTDALYALMEKSSHQRRMINVQDHEATKIIIALSRLYKYKRPIHRDHAGEWFANDEIYSFMSSGMNVEFDFSFSRTALGKKLANLHLEPKVFNKNGAKRCYKITVDMIDHLFQRFNIPAEFNACHS